MLRPRIIVYGVLLLGLFAVFAVGIARRSPLIVDVMRDKQLYHLNDEGNIENAYTLRVINKDNHTHTYKVSIDSHADIGIEHFAGNISLQPEEVQTLPITLVAKPGKVKGVAEVKFILEQTDGKAKVTEESRFIAPLEHDEHDDADDEKN